MNNFTQRELISESFWSSFKKPFKVARGLAHAGGKIASIVAPEITQPLSNAKHHVKNVGAAFQRGYHGISSPEEVKWNNQNVSLNPQIAMSVSRKINMGLANKGYSLEAKYGFQPNGIDPKNGSKLYKVRALEPKNNKLKWLVVDERGNIKNLMP